MVAICPAGRVPGVPDDVHAENSPDIHQIIDRRLVRSVFQPLVALDTLQTCAVEALSRGPADGGWSNPMRLFDAARDAGRLADLDALCLTTALATARAARPSGGMSLFVNTEPSVTTAASLAPVIQAGHTGFAVTLEFTERDLCRDVAGLLGTAEQVRDSGGRVAIDDVGADAASLALIPLLRPEVVKLDLSLIRDYGRRIAEVSNAVRAYAEESGATVVAEGIETESDLDIARVLGATVGQGWLFGRPGELSPLSADDVPVPAPRRLTPPEKLRGDTPYDVVTRAVSPCVSTKRLLLPISRTLEEQALAQSLPPLVLAGFQQQRFFSGDSLRRYVHLAERLPLVCAFGTGVMPQTRNVRVTELRVGDPMADEWTVIVLGAHFAAALVSRDLGDTGEDSQRRFSYAVTHDHSLVAAAARTLVGRVARAT